MNKILSFWNDLFGRTDRKAKTILVIDDSELDRRLYLGMLDKRYNVLQAASGSEGLSLAKDRRPDVILLDFELPDYKGPEICRMLKEEGTTKNIPIIMLTAFDMPANVIASFNGGVDMYLSKPVRAGELFKQLEMALMAPAVH